MPNLFIDVEARFAKFQDSLDQIKRQADGFVGSLTRSFGRVQTLFVGLGVSLGAAGIVANLRDVVNAADELQNVSEKTGLTVEALSELKFAADQTDVTFEELQDGLKKLAVAIDSNNDAFRRLDLDPAQFESTEDALAAIADRFRAMEDPIASAAIAIELFGRNGTALIPFLKQGASGIQQFREEAQRLGVVFGGDFAKQAEQFNDNLKKIQATFQAFNILVTNSTLGPLADWLERLLKIKEVTGSLFGAITIANPADLFRSTIDSIRATEEAITKARDEIAKLKKDLSDPRLFGTARLAVQAELSSVEASLPRNEKRLELLSFDRERQIQRDPRLRELAKRGQDPRNLDARDLGAQDLVFTPGAAKEDRPDKPTKSKTQSNFESLEQSLVSRLNQERRLTEELKLVEDERFSSLSKNQQQSLVTLAQRIDLITQEKTAREITEQSSSAASSIEESSVRNELDIIERRKVSLTQEFEDRKLGIQEYYSLLAAEEDNAFNVQLQHIETLRQERLDVASDAGSDERGIPNQSIQARLKATADVAALEQEITRITRDREDNVINTARTARDAEFRQLEEQIKLTQELNSIQGRSNVEFDREALLFQFRGLSQEIQESLTFKVFIDAKLAEQQFDQFEQRVEQIQSRRQVREQSASISRDSGTITQSEFSTAVVEIRKESVQLIEQEIEKLSELAKSNDIVLGEEQITRLEVLRNELFELKQSTDVYLNSFKDASESEATDFFEAIISGSEDADVALKKFAESVKANLNRKLAKEFTDSLFGGIRKATAEKGGVTGVIDFVGSAIQKFLGFGSKPAPIQQQGVSFDGGGVGFRGQDALQSGGGLGLDLSSQGIGGQVSTEGIDALSDAALEGSSAISDLSTAADLGGSSADLFSSTLDAGTPDVSNSMGELVVSSAAAEIGTQSLATSTTTAAAQIAAAGARASAASIAVADGGIFSGGYHVAFADGGIVSSPTTFPLAGGGTGLMGEAGTEAIMPARVGSGGYEVRGLRADGGIEFLALGRDSGGKLSVVLPDLVPGDSSVYAPAFARSDIYEDSSVYAPAFALDQSREFASSPKLQAGHHLIERERLDSSQEFVEILGTAPIPFGLDSSREFGEFRGIASLSSMVEESYRSVDEEKRRRYSDLMTSRVSMFADGGVLDDGKVEAFAAGGIVSRPTFFPMRDGKRGLMGEAGPEAIVPVKPAGGGFAAIGVLSSGQEISVALTRNAAGKLAIQMPDIAPPAPASEFASGDIFQSGAQVINKYSARFADGGLIYRGQALAVRTYMGGGIADRPQLALFGEGSMNEAFVPLPDGRSIPVTLEDSGGSGGVTVIQNISTPDATSFRRSRAALFNDLQAGLTSAAGKS